MSRQGDNVKCMRKYHFGRDDVEVADDPNFRSVQEMPLHIWICATKILIVLFSFWRCRFGNFVYDDIVVNELTFANLQINRYFAFIN